MKVWLVTVGEPLPTDGGNPRLFRTGLLAKYLLEAGHEVIWWTSTFNHSIKEHRFSKQTRIEASESYEIIALHGRAYKTNISLTRILNHRDLAKEFRTLSAELEVPDVVVSSFPTIELCDEVIGYCNKNRIPSVTDVRDLWPDIFVTAVPRWLQPLASIAISGMARQTKRVFRKTTHIAGITDSYVEWGVMKGGRNRSSRDHVYHLTNSSKQYDADTVTEASTYLKSCGLDTSKTTIVFVGIISLRKFCLDTVLEGIKSLNQRDIQFVFAGDGDDLEELKKRAPDVVFTGWVDEPKLQVLLTSATLAIAPYRSSDEFMMSIPIKIFEYMSFGVPILASLKGEVKNLVESEEIGKFFAEEKPEEFAQTLTSLLNDSSSLEKMRSKANTLFADRFSVDKTFSDRVAHIEDISINFRERKKS